MLFWCWLISICTVILSKSSLKNESQKKTAIITHSAICSVFLIYIILTSNPFAKSIIEPSMGIGLNPLLQDIAVTIHPPILYMGYSCATVLFALAISGLTSGKIDTELITHIRSWAIKSWSILTLGIMLGSWWAYRELGWGGFWFWDPVENLSLLPWILTIALLHSISLNTKHNVLKSWSIFLCIIIFISILLGTFFIRSGLLISVHSFAIDENRYIFILIIIGIVSTSSIFLFFHRYKTINSSPISFSLFSQPGLILLNNAVLITLYAIILTGITYPIILDIIYQTKVSIGAPYYDLVFNRIAIPLLLIAGIEEYRKSIIILITTLSISTILFYHKDVIIVFSLASSLFLLCMNIRKDFISPMRLAHSGIAILVIGITISTGWEIASEKYMNINDTINVGSHTLTLEKVQVIERDNHHAVIASFNGSKQINAESRFYTNTQTITPEAGISHSLFYDLYLMIGNIDENLGIAVRLQYKPGISMIWIGCIMMSSSGLIKKHKKEKYALEDSNFRPTA